MLRRGFIAAIAAAVGLFACSKAKAAVAMTRNQQLAGVALNENGITFYNQLVVFVPDGTAPYCCYFSRLDQQTVDHIERLGARRVTRERVETHIPVSWPATLTQSRYVNCQVWLLNGSPLPLCEAGFQCL